MQYREKERNIGNNDLLPPKKNFIKAKYDFIDEMLKFSGMEMNPDKPIKVLDVGCGIGGTSR